MEGVHTAAIVFAVVLEAGTSSCWPSGVTIPWLMNVARFACPSGCILPRSAWPSICWWNSGRTAPSTSRVSSGWISIASGSSARANAVSCPWRTPKQKNPPYGAPFAATDKRIQSLRRGVAMSARASPALLLLPSPHRYQYQIPSSHVYFSIFLLHHLLHTYQLGLHFLCNPGTLFRTPA